MTGSDFKTRLGEILHDEGRSQTWLAARIGVHRSVISRIVNGLHASDDLKRAIADALGRQLDDVFPVEVAAS